MRPRDRVVGLCVRGAISMLRMAVLHLPPRILAGLFRLAGRTVYVVTGKREAGAPALEVAELFAHGAPYTVTLYKMFSLMNLEKEFLTSAAKCLARKSPYGAL